MHQEDSKRKVVVAGDVIVDVSMIRNPVRLSYHSQEVQVSGLKVRAGGAWYLRDVVASACADLADLSVSGPEQIASTCACETTPYPQAFQVWEYGPKVKGKKDVAVWRIGEFLGCKHATGAARHPTVTDDDAEPALLVLDDLGIDFARTPTAWPLALREGGNPAAVIVKADSLPDDSAFWARLRALAPRVTVVLSAEALREGGVRLPTPLSWDHAVKSVKQAFATGPAAEGLGCFKRVVIRFGLEGAASLTRHALRTPRNEPRLLEHLRFERFLYLPADLPGDLQASMPGQVFGANSILTAALARHEVGQRNAEGTVTDYPLFIALGRGLQAARRNHELGGGGDKESADPDAANADLEDLLAGRGANGDPAFAFYSAFDQGVRDSRYQPADPLESDLLADVCGSSRAGLLAKAIEVVLKGADVALAAAPRARYGKYLTADREEVERLTAIRRLIENYVSNQADKRPLSIAVFGPPGAGKSFAIKQVAKVLFPEAGDPLEFNLSQMSEDDLTAAFQQVRDASISGQTPLVFWDEFDSDGLTWLKHFLAPMQDAKFRSGGAMHPLAKCIFVFAGGTCHTFAAFSKQEGSPEYGAFVDLKGPDFVSRLRGYLNVKGPNPVVAETGPPGAAPQAAPRPDFDRRAADDVQYLLRRALILRSNIDEFFPHLAKANKAELPICKALVRAFLEAEDLTHGARSITSLVNMSTVGTALYYNASQLPPDALVKMHCPTLLDHLGAPELPPAVVEDIARACHSYWLLDNVLSLEKQDMKERARTLELPFEGVVDQVEAPGFRARCQGNDARQVPYGQLAAKDQDENRKTAGQASVRFEQAGWRIVRAHGAQGTELKATDHSSLQPLYLDEHDRWVRDHLLQGFEYVEKESRNKKLCLHPDIAPFDDLPDEHRSYDRVIVAGIIAALHKHGYAIVGK